MIRDTRALWLAGIEILSPRPECKASSESDFRDGFEDRGLTGSGSLRRRESMKVDFLFCIGSDCSIVGAVVMMVGAVTSQLSTGLGHSTVNRSSPGGIGGIEA